MSGSHDELTARHLRVALKAFGRIADRWHLSTQDRARVLGQSDRHAHHDQGDRHAQHDSVAAGAHDLFERLSLVIGIYAETSAVFGPDDASGWLTRPNSDFGGRSPLDNIISGKIEDIIAVRRYLAQLR